MSDDFKSESEFLFPRSNNDCTQKASKQTDFHLIINNLFEFCKNHGKVKLSVFKLGIILVASDLKKTIDNARQLLSSKFHCDKFD